MTKTVKPRINDVIVIEKRSSSTAANMKTTYHTSYTFALVAKVNRKGIVQQFKASEKALPFTLDRNQRVITITDPDRQADARVVFGSLAENFFTDIDDVRKLILGVREAA
jgi:hypothetical protein